MTKLVLKESELVKLILATLEGAQQQLQEQTSFADDSWHLPLGLKNGWNYQDGATYFISADPYDDVVVSFLGGPEAGDYGGFVPNDGRSYGGYDSYEEYRKNELYNTGEKQNKNFKNEKKRLLAWRSSVEFGGQEKNGVCRVYWENMAAGDDDTGSYLGIHEYLHMYGPQGYTSKVYLDPNNKEMSNGPTFIDNIRKWSDNPEYSLKERDQRSVNPCDYVELFNLPNKWVKKCEDMYDGFAATCYSTPCQKDILWEKMDKKLSKVSGYDKRGETTSNIKNIQFLNLVECLDKQAKKTLPKSTNYSFDSRTRSYTELEETKNDKSSKSSKSSSSRNPYTMDLTPIKTLDGVDLEVNPKFLETMEKGLGYLFTGAPSNEELPFGDGLILPASTVRFLEKVFNQGTKVFNKFIDGLQWMVDYCDGQGWYCVEIVAGTISLAMVVVTLFVGTTLAVEGVILFLGAVTVVALWEQGKRGWAIAVGFLEGLGIFRFLKMFKFANMGDEVTEGVMKFFEAPTTKIYSTLDGPTKEMVDFVIANRHTAYNILKNSDEAVDLVKFSKQVKNAKQFKLLTTTKEWQKVPGLRNIKTYDDFLDMVKFNEDILNYSFKISMGIRYATQIGKWTIGLGLPAFGAYIKYSEFQELFSDKVKAAFENKLDENGTTFEEFFSQEAERTCTFEAYVDILNGGCVPEWVEFLERETRHGGGSLQGVRDKNERLWEDYVEQEMALFDTDDVTDIYENLFQSVKLMYLSAEDCLLDPKNLEKLITECGLGKFEQSVEDKFDVKQVFNDLMGIFNRGVEDEDEREFLVITASLSPDQKIKVREYFADEGECLCDLIEDNWMVNEKEILQMWDMWEPDNTKGLNMFSNCTCID